MTYTLRLFGFPILTLEIAVDAYEAPEEEWEEDEELYIRNTGGSFGFEAPDGS